MPVDATMNSPAHTRALSGLLPDLPGGYGEVRVSGIAYDSRVVKPGDLFFALPGAKTDGAQFARDAVANGASAVVATADLGLPVPCIVADNPRRLMAEVSHRFFGHPDRALDVIGVVGTNGKSTVAAGLQTVWESAGVAAGLLGTVTYRWGAESHPAERTTPEAPDLDRFLSRMRADGVRTVAMEVSSHAIALDRVWGLHFRGGVFTNLTRDHLDFHKTFADYRDTKKRFFERLTAPTSFAAINLDDPVSGEFALAAAAARVIRYAGTRDDADVHLDVQAHDLTGTRGRLVIDGESWPLASPLWGRFNHANLAAIAAAAHATGVPGATIAAAMATFHGISGRTERVPSSAPFPVFVDYAHTPDALDAVLSSARPLVRGRLLVLFGCGGDRDRGKRPEMAHAVEQWADRIYLTSDNPRSEDPEAIISDVKKGFAPGIWESHVWCDPDRARAIARVVADAKAGDAVFLCGKGHEQEQEIAGVRHRFSDRDQAAEALAAAGYTPPVSPPGGGGR
ncbi:MAG: UDP-N-acetylmuramoyl-L-alanyl-D-glutamate--2,6-diaminopimelate ligase [Candidatus Zixiibacteriota bacterium]